MVKIVIAKVRCGGPVPVQTASEVMEREEGNEEKNEAPASVERVIDLGLRIDYGPFQLLSRTNRSGMLSSQNLDGYYENINVKDLQSRMHQVSTWNC
ncbi:hypothetical protein RB195_021234 [Necator americanus]|uniref:Uncharacterized protein n=1 Tax=Necator americanus TaxID=51031 RepID=A0ABR1EC07_NECAM